ncbi:MAG: diguanylate cyclase [Spirochaetaceae bacterium]|nr:diguanylate cyclase [Spirochaetaceae bacterium]
MSAAEGPPPAAASARRADRLVFTTMTSREGLSNSSVSSIVQDEQGFIWFGTQGGLDRYDGYGFKSFQSDPFNENCLSQDQIQTLYRDGNVLWIGTYGGLSRLDLETERFTTYRFEPDRADSLSNDVVVCIARDARGSLWVGTLKGLNRLDEKTGSFERFLNDPADPRSLPADVVRDLHIDAKGRFWVATSGGGLARVDYERGGFEVLRRDPKDPATIMSDFVMSLDEDAHGVLWVGTWYGGLSRFDPETGRFANIVLGDERVYVVSAAEPGTIYVGTWGGGLYEYRVADGRVESYRASDAIGALSHDIVYSILRDRSGEIWIGTNGGGVNKLSRARRSYEVYRHDSHTPESLAFGKVNALFVDRRGTLWAGVYNGGLDRFDADSGSWKHYRRDPARPRSLPNDIVNAIEEDSAGRLWIASNDGFASYDPARDDFDVVRPIPGRGDWLSNEVIFALKEAPDGGLWVGTYRKGLEYWDRAKNRFVHYAPDPADPKSLSDALVYSIEYDSAGRLWVGTNKGLNRLEDGGFVRYFYDRTKPGGISGDTIRQVFRDSRGVLWIGSFGGGLMRYEPETDSFVHYTMADGLPGNAVVRITEDSETNLWISTLSGLAFYDRSTGLFRTLSVYNDLRDRELNNGAARGLDGNLYFGALGVVYRLDPARYEFNSHRPPVVLTGLSVLNKEKPLRVAAHRLGVLSLSHRENAVEFEFSALDFRDPEKNQYAYRLEGFDADWIQSGNRNFAAYTNLPGGRYVFRVKASNNDGVWNDSGLSLPIRVGTPPWLSPLAFILYALALGGAVYEITVWKSRAVLRAKVAELAAAEGELEKAKVQLERLGAIDALTGLANRRKLDAYLEREFAGAAKQKNQLAALMIDIDSFKAYNDRYGHQAGDECLRRVAGCLTASIDRSTDLITRYGGEEFFILLPDTDLEGARIVGQKLRAAVEALAIPHGESRVASVVTISVGCAVIRPEPGDEVAGLVTSADRALYAAKERGRNRVEC